MAIPAQSCTVTFGGVTLTELSKIEINETISEGVSRDGTWAASRGSVSISAYADLSAALLGQRKQLVFELPSSTTPGAPAKTIFEWDAIYRERKPSAEVNDAIRFDFAFTISDTENASS